MSVLSIVVWCNSKDCTSLIDQGCYFLASTQTKFCPPFSLLPSLFSGQLLSSKPVLSMKDGIKEAWHFPRSWSGCFASFVTISVAECDENGGREILGTSWKHRESIQTTYGIQAVSWQERKSSLNLRVGAERAGRMLKRGREPQEDIARTKLKTRVGLGRSPRVSFHLWS